MSERRRPAQIGMIAAVLLGALCLILVLIPATTEFGQLLLIPAAVLVLAAFLWQAVDASKRRRAG
jgi:4-hydroxybenzoate polyprenyltransferase